MEKVTVEKDSCGQTLPRKTLSIAHSFEQRGGNLIYSKYEVNEFLCFPLKQFPAECNSSKLVVIFFQIAFPGSYVIVLKPRYLIFFYPRFSLQFLIFKKQDDYE